MPNIIKPDQGAGAKFSPLDQSTRSDPQKSYIPSSVRRSRWNVLDVLRIFGRRTVPATLECEIDMQAGEALCAQFERTGTNVTITALMIKAIAMAQCNHPLTKAFQLPFCRVAIPDGIVAGFTVERSVENEPTVFFGTIDRPETKTLEAITHELHEYAVRPIDEHPVLSQQLRFSKMPWLLRRLVLRSAVWFPEVRLRYMPATFGLTSLGKFDVTALGGPCICTSTIGVGCVSDRAVVRNGKLEVKPMMTISLIFDNIIIDGAPAARFLQDVKSLMESS